MTEANEAKAGEWVFNIDANEEEVFVVDEVGIVFGFPLLDQFAFEEERLAFAVHFDDVDIVNEINHGANFGLGVLMST